MFPEVRREDAAVLNRSEVSELGLRIDLVLTMSRICNQPTRWKKRNEQHNRQSCKS